jgi:hypothetical protein
VRAVGADIGLQSLLCGHVQVVVLGDEFLQLDQTIRNHES